MIAVIGSTNMDLITYTERMPVIGETFTAHNFTIAPGGKGANQAVAAARMGAEVLMLTRIGDDIFGKDALHNFEENGILTDYVLTTSGTTGVASITVDNQSQNSILVVPGANNALSPADIEAASDALAQCNLIVLQLEVPLETVYAAIDYGVSNSIPVILNPAPASMDFDLQAIRGCTFFIPNETELATLTGLSISDVHEAEKAARLLLDYGCPHIIVTMGSRGVLWVSQEGAQFIESVPVDAVDTTGAGDSFIGSFASQIAAGVDIPAALATANRYAALSVMKAGTQTSYPYAKDL